MKLPATTKGGRHVNVLFQLLKFLLIILAIYTVRLQTQTGISLPATIGFLNTTPAEQESTDGRITISFYALEFFGKYDNAKVDVWRLEEGDLSAVKKDLSQGKWQPLLPTQLGGDISSTKWLHHLYFFLPVTTEKVTQYIKYKAVCGSSTSRDYGPFGVNYTPLSQFAKIHSEIIEVGPLSLVVAQGRKLPEKIRGMALDPVEIKEPSVGGGSPKQIWPRSSQVGPSPVEINYVNENLKYSGPTLEDRLYELTCVSLMKVSKRNGDPRIIETQISSSSGRSSAGPELHVEATRVVNPEGQDVDPAKIKEGSWVAFEGECSADKKNCTPTRVIVSPTESLQVKISFTLRENQAPRSIYSQTPQDINIYTNWLALDIVNLRAYFNLDLYVVDPDGQDAQGKPSVRARKMRLVGNPQGLELPDPTTNAPEFRLYVSTEILSDIQQGASKTVEITASDEMSRPQPLKININPGKGPEELLNILKLRK